MKNLTLNIIAVPRLLDLIGTSMYSDYCKAISELVINGYDADAGKILVEVTNERVQIADNGSGMTPQELQDSFLKFGGGQKGDVKKTELFKREPVGNKGIGKWAGLGIAKKMVVITEREGIRSRFVLDYNELLKYKDIKDIKIDGTTEICDQLAHGTKVILTDLNVTNVNKQRLVEHLSRELPLDGNIHYYVNGVECKRTDIKSDIKRYINSNIAGIGQIKGELIIPTKRLDKIQPGVIVRVRGRQVGKPCLFSIPLNSKYATYSHLITGEVSADGLNSYIKTDREGFNEDSDAYQNFYKFMDKEVTDLVKEKYQKAIIKTSIRELKEKTEILQHISRIFNKIQDVTHEKKEGEKYGISKKGEEGFIKTDEDYTGHGEKGESSGERQTNPVGITDRKVRKLVKVKPGIGKIRMGNKSYKVVISPNGIDDKECRIDDEICVITINEDHPSYIFARNAKNRAFIEYQLFKSIATAYAYKTTENIDKFYEMLDGYMRVFVKEAKREFNFKIDIGEALEMIKEGNKNGSKKDYK